MENGGSENTKPPANAQPGTPKGFADHIVDWIFNKYRVKPFGEGNMEITLASKGQFFAHLLIFIVCMAGTLCLIALGILGFLNNSWQSYISGKSTIAKNEAEISGLSNKLILVESNLTVASNSLSIYLNPKERAKIINHLGMCEYASNHFASSSALFKLAFDAESLEPTSQDGESTYYWPYYAADILRVHLAYEPELVCSNEFRSNLDVIIQQTDSAFRRNGPQDKYHSSSNGLNYTIDGLEKIKYTAPRQYVFIIDEYIATIKKMQRYAPNP